MTPDTLQYSQKKLGTSCIAATTSRKRRAHTATYLHIISSARFADPLKECKVTSGLPRHDGGQSSTNQRRIAEASASEACTGQTKEKRSTCTQPEQQSTAIPPQAGRQAGDPARRQADPRGNHQSSNDCLGTPIIHLLPQTAVSKHDPPLQVILVVEPMLRVHEVHPSSPKQTLLKNSVHQAGLVLPALHLHQ